MTRRYPPLQCDGCGRFIACPFDAYTRFGIATDLEPPDPVLLCERCHWSDLISMVEFGRKGFEWIKSDATRTAGSILRYIRRHPERLAAIVAELRVRAA